MARRQHHYERAFGCYLRDQRLPYVAVNEARRALLPPSTQLTLNNDKNIKNFDFVVYNQSDESHQNLLVEIKGRRLPRLRKADGTPSKPRLESWVTLDDVSALTDWQSLFGPKYTPVFVFVYWCDDVPPDGLFAEVFAYQSRWYTLRAVTLEEYKSHMTPRSAKWRTVNLPSKDYERLYRRFVPRNSREGTPFPESTALIQSAQTCSVHA